MEFGKLETIEGVELALPADPAGTRQFLTGQAPDSSRPLLYIGCTGWSVKEWVGRVYPAHTRTPDFLHHYTRQFNTIELNTTHYRIPDSAIIEKWRTTAPDDFHYCPKIPQSISHSADLGRNGRMIPTFTDAIEQLGDRLGPGFLQLPPHFGPERAGILRAFLDRFPDGLPLAVEFRHPGWFKDRSFFEELRSRETGTVITDVAGRRDVLHMELTTNFVLVRFVGNNLHGSDFSRIDEWVERMEDWFAKGLNKMYFFCHEPDNLLAPELSVYLLDRVKMTGGIETRGPELIDPPGAQMSLFGD